MQSGSFLDRVKIYVTAGKGGDGCLSFRREKFIEFGGPNGGNGGRGGDVIIRAESNLTTLLELAYKRAALITKQAAQGKTKLFWCLAVPSSAKTAKYWPI